jgi:hypothetical protein
MPDRIEADEQLIDKRLYLERWLLRLKRMLLEDGLEAHVHALDRKGGVRLALRVHTPEGAEPRAAELRFRKGWRGEVVLAAANSPELVRRLVAVTERFVTEHRGFTRGGARRFARRVARMLTALAGALGDAGAIAQTAAQLADIPGAEGALPALYVQRLPGWRWRVVSGAAGARFEEVLEAPRGLGRLRQLVGRARVDETVVRFAALGGGRLISLQEQIEREQERTVVAQRATVDEDSIGAFMLEAGVELVFTGGAFLADAVGAGEAAGAAAETAGAAAEAVGASAEGAGAAGEAAAGLGDVIVDAGAGAVEAVTGAGSCLGDAACVSVDCGALDCLGALDCIPL